MDSPKTSRESRRWIGDSPKNSWDSPDALRDSLDESRDSLDESRESFDRVRASGILSRASCSGFRESVLPTWRASKSLSAAAQVLWDSLFGPRSGIAVCRVARSHGATLANGVSSPTGREGSPTRTWRRVSPWGTQRQAHEYPVILGMGRGVGFPEPVLLPLATAGGPSAHRVAQALATSWTSSLAK
jgi:hypothetical protein